MDLPKQFRVFLISQQLSASTVKNYVADINHFLTWLRINTGVRHQVAGEGIFALFTAQTIQEYQQSLITAKTPASTAKRHLSALRKFGQFGQSQNWLKTNPALKIDPLPLKPADNQDKILQEFSRFLKKEKVSPLTGKNYLSDLRHFLAWLEKA